MQRIAWRAVRCYLDTWIQPVLLVKLPRGLQWWQWTDLQAAACRTARVSANRLSAVYYGTGMEACRMVDSSMNFIMNALGPWGVDSGFMYLLVTFYLLYVYGVRVRVPV